MKLIDKLAWIELVNGSILSTKSYNKDRYFIPGGKREPGETDEQALCREIKEELSVNLDKNTLQLVGIFQAHAHGHPPDTFVKMTCYTAAYTGQLKPAAEIEEMVWLTCADMDKIAAVDILIFHFLKEQGLLR